jgi:HEAT repeat protein
MRDTAQATQTLPTPVEPERLLMMGLELGAAGEGVWQAVEELTSTRLGVLLRILHTAPPGSALTPLVWERVLASDATHALLDAEEPDFEALDLLLGHIGSEGAGAILDILSESDSLATRSKLFNRLAALGPSIAPEVIRRTRDKRWFARRNMLALMGEFESWPPKWSPAEYSEDPHPAVRRESLKLMLRLPHCRDRALCGLLGDGDPRAMGLGLAAAVEACPPEAVPLLADIVCDESMGADLRVMAVRALGLSGDPVAVAPLLDLVQEGMPRRLKLLRSRRLGSSPIMLAALQALSTFPNCPAEAQRVLAKAAESGDPKVRAAALGLQEP